MKILIATFLYSVFSSIQAVSGFTGSHEAFYRLQNGFGSRSLFHHGAKSQPLRSLHSKSFDAEYNGLDHEESTEHDDVPDLNSAEVYDLLDDQEDQEGNNDSLTDDAVVVTMSQQKESSPSVQYAALGTGSLVQIQVGDINLARKAWKKRRRTGSPLLVPCSILNLDRSSAVRHNIVYLLEKFGLARSNNRNAGIKISFPDLNQRYRSHFKFSLQKHASALGFATSQELIEHLLNPQMQETFGIKIENNGENDQPPFLWSPLSRHRAQKQANLAAVLQFLDEPEPLGGSLVHTGLVRNKNQQQNSEQQQQQQSDGNFYRLQPLSAALRVSQKEDVDSGNIQNGSLHSAVVFHYDPTGDAGLPLLTLSLNPSRNSVRDRLKINNNPKHQVPVIIRNPQFQLQDLHMGDGPFTGQVVRLHKGGVWVDCSVGRPLPRKASNGEGEMVQVLGFLRFNDTIIKADKDFDDGLSVQAISNKRDNHDDDDIVVSTHHHQEVEEDAEDESLELASFGEPNPLLNVGGDDDEFEEDEDLTHLFEIDINGSLVYNDETTGERRVISSEEDMEEDEEEDEEEEDLEENEEMDGPVVFQEPQQLIKPTSGKKQVQRIKRFRIGDELDVFVKSVSTQSGRLLLTLDSTVQGKKPIEVKREGEVEKKLNRLDKQLGGLHRIDELKGMEMDGVVKAISNTGNWLYVQPSSNIGLPVGVATLAEEISSQGLKQGDAVVVRLEGIDSSRGQLSLKVLHKKLAP